MSPNPSSRRGIGLTLCAYLALGTAGCQHEPAPADQPAARSGLGTESPGDVTPPPALAESEPRTIPPVETLRQDARQVEHSFDAGVRQAAEEVEEALPPPTAPAPIDPATGQGLESAVSEINQGVKQASGEFSGAVRETTDEVRQSVRRKVDAVKQDLQQSADQLARKAKAQTRRKTDQFLDKVEQKGKETLQQGYDRAREQIQGEAAPKP
jgi:hypothetical protein